MAKRYLLLSLFFILSTQIKAQQYGLFNTKTLFDAFENPAQKAFVLDSSRQYASNFLLPYFGLNAANKGDANFGLRSYIHDRSYNTSGIPIGNNARNQGYQGSNIYLFTFRIFKSYKDHQELGFSWQMRSDAYADYTNETLVAFDDYRRFNKSQDSPFNGNGYGQSYHQFSMNYRENVDKQLAFGVKLSLLSGITYNKINITQSDIQFNGNPGANDQLTIGFKGTYQSNFLRAKELDFNTLIPDFKNPGLSVGFGTTYTSKTGFFLMGSVKDLGFIRWNKNSHSIFVPNGEVVVNNLSSGKELQQKFEDQFIDRDEQHAFYTATNAKTDFLISKKFDFYTPNFIISKNLWNKGGDIALVNNFSYDEFSVSLSPIYNLNGFMMLGTQAKYQTPNFEFFLGSDNVLKSAAYNQQPGTTNNSYAGASVYMGVGIKFGYTVEHPQNSSYMPGVGDDADRRGFFSKLFGIFKKK
ncbi:hypothetical protein HDF26_002691 [Pedobacter cryoconitis]|uniref:DUF5723 domain-containing protein n=1 Tax=Pedobacter cryoconitis TaxID=188932 RepID=A0A7W8ZIF6_9SPHI|nr:DUF5723 family protein [Pedobacter cryoconitis]MBB5634636.1 hypothetical protein [Pedobacter cryoconitis]MBB6272234.1 hypothetical protein [Pedobacter cryoconitis]